MRKEITEKCGVIAMIGQDFSPADFQNGFKSQQNRGQDVAGKLVVAETFECSYVDGHISELLEAKDETNATIFLGHNRYTTSMGITTSNRQPIFLSSENYKLGLAHNGNIPKDRLSSLRDAVEDHVDSEASDSVIMAQILLNERNKYTSWSEAFISTLPLFQGAFSLACVTEEECLYAMRDPWGIRPLSIGHKGKSWIVASESNALVAADASYMRELLPGELIRIDNQGNFESYLYAAREEPEQRCLLETIYFSRNASFDGTSPMREKRRALGRVAARRFKQKNIGIDLIIPILNSGKEMTVGVAEELGQEHVEAIHVRGEQRSFIQNTNGSRRKVVHEKHIVDAEMISGKRILLCDDSLIRGVSLQILIQKIQSYKEGLPSEIHVLLGSEPVVDICDLGVDISTQAELATAGLDLHNLTSLEQAIAKSLGIDSVTYIDRNLIKEALGTSDEHMCFSCFGGPHPIRENRRPTYRFESLQKLKNQKVMFLASGSGTNVENVLQKMSEGTITAEAIGVITNKEDAGVKERAMRFGVETKVISSRGKLKDANSRLSYENELLELILNNPKGIPDVIVLAGWMLILSDNFLAPLMKAGIEIINLHPALLGGTGTEFVASSMGKVPELRGAHAIDDAFQSPISSMPVTGITIHHVVPAGDVDTGPIILKEEVARKQGETIEELASHIHEAEHRSLPIALQKVLLERLAKGGT